MALPGLACLLALLLGAAALPAEEVLAGDPKQINGNEGTSHISVATLDPTRAIQCFVDWGTGEGVGTCNILGVDSGPSPIFAIVSTHIFKENRTHNVQVEAFSSSAAVVCYADDGNTYVMCKTLTITGDTISDSQPYVINTDAPGVPFFSMTRFSDSEGVVCWSSSNWAYTAHAGVCNKLTLSGSEITVGAEYFFDFSSSVTDISIQAFSDSTAVLCYRSGAQGTGVCDLLTLGSQTEDFSRGTPQGFFETPDEAFKSVVVVNFGEDNGAVCYAGGTNHDYVGCKAVSIGSSGLTLGSEENVINSHPTKWVTATSIADRAALVCYAADEGVGSNDDDWRGKPTCNVVGALGTTTLDASLPREVRSDPSDFLSVASLESESAMLCFSNFGAGAGSCMKLILPETTTSTTATETTATETTETETSSTTPHTTTATSTTTPAIWIAAAEWSECSSVCGEGEQTRTVTCSATDERLCDASARMPDSRQCQQYTQCPYDWTCPMGPDGETGSGCGTQGAIVFGAVCVSGGLAAALCGLCALRMHWGSAPSGVDKEGDLEAAEGRGTNCLPDDGTADAFQAFEASIEATERKRARGVRRQYPRQPGRPKGLDFAHPAGMIAGSSLSSTALDRAAIRARDLLAMISPRGPPETQGAEAQGSSSQQAEGSGATTGP